MISRNYFSFKNMTFIRNLVQVAFLGSSLYLGFQLAAFFNYFISQGQQPFVSRPTGVDAFLPIGALISLKNWLVNGHFDHIHPAALVFLLTFLTLSFLTRKSFCSWICPVGTISEWLYRVQSHLLGFHLQLWPWLDKILRALKYLLLLFFIKLILIDMPAQSLAAFLSSPYWAISDFKMLHFFTSPTITTLVVISIFTLLSLFIRLFWCRYLCPYGALLGLLSFLSPCFIRRHPESCTRCQCCDQTCPAHLHISTSKTIHSVECTGCLSCVQNCPQPGALHISLLGYPLPPWVFMVIVLVIFSGGLLIGIISGHWHSSLMNEDYVRMIPLLKRF